MTKRRGPSAEQRGEIEMPPLDHVFPAEMGVPQAPVEAKEVAPVIEKPLYHEQVYEEEVPEEQDEVENVEEVDQEEPELSPSTVDSSSKKPKTQQENFREVRLAKERAERERDALMSQMLEMQSKLQAQQHVAQQVDPKPVIQEKEWFDDIDPESLVEGKQVKKIAEDMRSMKKLLMEQQIQAQQLAMEAKIKSQYPDFDQVFNADNIQQLNNSFPDIAQALRGMPDDYGKATAAYTMIKNLGIANQQKGNEMKKQTYESDILKAKVNAAKPRPLTSVNPQQGDSPLSKANAFANGLTPDLKEQMRKEMAAARKGH